MSYERMAQEDFCCDFPGCDNRFNQEKAAKVALIKGGKTMAFCKKHSTQLQREGVVLRTLDDIHAEQKERENGPRKRREEAERAAREQNFINSLK